MNPDQDKRTACLVWTTRMNDNAISYNYLCELTGDARYCNTVPSIRWLN